MEKYKLLNILSKTGKRFKDKNPSGIYYEIFNKSINEHLSHVLKDKDLILYCLLAPRLNMGSDVDVDYDLIENNLFTIELVEIYETNPLVDCPECEGEGYNRCSNCGGDGEEECRRCDSTGEEDCDYCDGSGEDEEGEECHNCEGAGRTTCGRCNGSGYESCGWCGGDGDVACDVCNGDGKVESEFMSEVTYDNFVSWNEKWKIYFANIKHGEEVDSNDINNFRHSNQTILLSSRYELSEDYEGFVEGETILFRMNEKPNFVRSRTLKQIDIS